MTRQELADILGAEFLRDLALEFGVTVQAVQQWGPVLSPQVEDKVISHLWRIKHPKAPDRRRSRSMLAA